jgi:thiol-disulfide isomerase/thioredoxin
VLPTVAPHYAIKECQSITTILEVFLRKVVGSKKIISGCLIDRRKILSLALAGPFLGSSASRAEARSYRFALWTLSGSLLTSEQLRGRRVFMDVWAIWCAPCLASLPTIQALSREYSNRPGVAVVSVYAGKNYGRYRGVADFMRENQYTFDVGLDPDNLFTKQLGAVPQIISLPKYILFDEEGRIFRRFSGLDYRSIAEIRRYLTSERGQTPERGLTAKYV